MARRMTTQRSGGQASHATSRQVGCPKPMFEKILIANRGAIAVRIARTCERLGIATVAVCSDVEQDALHAQTCDEVVSVGGARVQDSYLNKQAIIEAAKKTGAQAIHPGYGLLSENPGFVR